MGSSMIFYITKKTKQRWVKKAIASNSFAFAGN